ncbi:glycoside hydrolase family 65 protein [Actinacidiphila bryophytorum]|uniref:Glycoside hydrolase family 65 protein n=1 Tax=Actinacidiphila bryophytorum TaxID=1436133 RepID=A0A9W4E3I3_9ACTN|nr:glycosyl hydrolase family 65 protein [Actinacidiphila bryophytorum]MBM9438412.1 glycoside hydrolase family 65 protein [Actinacidiphila bryophytorum]CAG7613868.1 Glycoside hydrolase family 65 protein [Actinacidiphila bryophytorum]
MTANAWTLSYEGYAPQDEPLREALCTVGNGYLATRGAAAEAVPGGVHYPGTYAAGIYNRLSSRIAGQDVANESLVNLPHWPAVTFRIDGGPWFDAGTAQLLDYRQCLDLREAVLTRWLRFRDERGRTTAVTWRRFASMAFAHACAAEVTVVPEDWSGSLEFRSLLDGRVRNCLVARYRDLPAQHLEAVRAEHLSDDSVLLEVRTNQSGIEVAIAARTVSCGGREPAAGHGRLLGGTGWIGHDLAVDVTQGEPVRLEKVVTVFTARDRAIGEPAADAARWLGRLDGFDALHRDHVRAWRRLWPRFRVTVTGDDDAQRVVRLHLLHLLQTLSPHTADLDVGVPARGLHGEAYRGHVFWDELFVFPVLNLRLPDLTRALLRYRHRRLPEARQAAREAGLKGAMFPWQSGSDGREESQRLHLNPLSGRWNPDPTWRQHHIGSAVAYNIWQYYQATGDREFLTHHGAEMLLEIARFWASAATWDPGRARYVIRGVMGPDEFHTGYTADDSGGIDNNAYTNVMAVWVILRALDALAALPEQARADLTDTLELHSVELERWRHVTRAMYVPFHDDGVFSQFEGYEHLEELDWDAYRQRYGDIRRLDRILEAEGESVNRYKASKQADALMLFYLLSADELGQLLRHMGYPLKPDAIPRTIDYYLARTSHGSTLSAVVHAWVLARAHRERAMEFYRRALRSDLTDIQGGTTPEGIHLAAMAGSVDLLQRCFSGLETRADRLVLNPFWPQELGVLELTVRYRQHLLTLHISGHRVQVTAGSGVHRAIKVSCRDETAELRPGTTLRFPLASGHDELSGHGPRR